MVDIYVGIWTAHEIGRSLSTEQALIEYDYGQCAAKKAAH